MKDPQRDKQKAEDPEQMAATKTSRGLHELCGTNE